MELKEMAKRQAEAQKQREQKAFITEPPSRLVGYTGDSHVSRIRGRVSNASRGHLVT